MLLLLHLVHATEQSLEAKESTFYSPSLVACTASLTHTHPSASREEEGLHSPFSQLLIVIDPLLLIPSDPTSLR